MAPRIGVSYLRALTPRPGRTTALPSVELTLRDVAVSGEHVARYARVCGFGSDGTLPPTYPHVLAFPAALALLTRRDFPLPALGLVHVANRITVRRPIGVGERLTFVVRPERLRAETAGVAFDIVASAVAGGSPDGSSDAEPVWESVSTYLRRGPRPPGQRPAVQAVQRVTGGESWLWRVPADTGRRYAAVSGDRNPIHLHALTARLFGFRTAIAHGMWAKARVLATLGPRLPRGYTVEVAFRSPVPLPCSVRLTADGERFALTTPDGDRTHLHGTVTGA